MHSHILPGIDDGSPDVETSLELIRGLMEMGLTRSVATPHIISDLYRNTPETIGKALNKLQEALDKNQLNYQVSAAAEYMLDNWFFELLKTQQPLLVVKDNIILTEFSFSYMPSHPEEMSFSIITEGYTPILAHPERYGYYHDNTKMYNRLKELGFLLQVNLLSLTGYYGKDVARAAKYIIKNGLASFVGTDLHHYKHLDAFREAYVKGLFKEWLGHQLWNGELV
ncbi:MAG: CpsB/CapC family capsule biosynthesis tyrosine phosphatase [Ferruginibacter sp.]